MENFKMVKFDHARRQRVKYPKLACAKIVILHPADFRGLKMCENQIFFIRSKHRIYHKYGIGIYIEFHHRL